MSLTPYPFNITLGEESPLFIYQPFRDGIISDGWNASYTGSPAYSAPGVLGSGTPYRATQKDHATVSITFDGTAVYLCVATENGAGISLYLDGLFRTAQAELPPMPMCSQFQDARMFYAEGLRYGTHNASIATSIENVTGAAVKFYGGTVTSAISTNVALVDVTIDDRDPGWDYQSPSWDTWGNGTWPEDFKGTHKFTCEYAPNVIASYTFSETYAVELLGIADYKSFAYTVSLNGFEASYSSANYWRANNQTMFFAADLDFNSTYQLSIANYDPSYPTGPANTCCSCLYLDALVLYKATPQNKASPTSPPATAPSAPTSPTNNLTTQAKAGISVGIFVTVSLLAAMLWACRRAAKRSRQVLHREAMATALQQVPEPFLGALTPMTEAFRPRRKDTMYTTLRSSMPNGSDPVEEQSPGAYPETSALVMEHGRPPAYSSVCGHS